MSMISRLLDKVLGSQPHTDFKARISAPYNSQGDFGAAVRGTIRPRIKTIPHRVGPHGIAGPSTWVEPVYDLSEISRAADVEAMLATSFRKHRELMFKEGYFLEGKNDDAIRAVRRRLLEISVQSGRPFEDLIREIGTNLIRYHTAFFYLRRDRRRSTGAPIRLFGKRLDPIAALEPVDPTTMMVKQTKSGRVEGWKQRIATQGEETEFDRDEILPITMDRKTGFVFGTPYCIPVLDDILALRRIEELVSVIAQKHAFPLYHHRVGTKELPMRDVRTGDGGIISEVELVRNEIEDMPSEGSLVTSNRHEIVVIGAEGEALDLSKYIQYFEARVLGGLRLSGIDLGRGGTTNRGTATTIGKNLSDAVKDYQTVLATAITFNLLNVILLEEGFNLNEENIVYLRFPSVDREEHRAQENHLIGLYQSNLITEEEARTALGREAVSESEEEGLYFNRVLIPTAEAGELAKAKAAERLTSIKNRPENQSGQAQSKPRIPKNDMLLHMRKIWEDTRADVASLDDLEAVRDALEDSDAEMLKVARAYLSDIISPKVPHRSKDRFFSRLVKKELRAITTRTNVLMRELPDGATVNGAFDAISPLVQRVGERLHNMVEALNMVEDMRSQGKALFMVNGMPFDLSSDLRDVARAMQGAGVVHA